MTSSFIFTTRGKKILLIRHGYGNRKWHLPGGMVEKGETPADTAIRELFEETEGIVKSAALAGKIYTHGYGFSYIYAGKLENSPRKGPGNEISEIGFFNFSNVPRNISKFARERIQLAMKNRHKITPSTIISRFSSEMDTSDAKAIVEGMMDDAIEKLCNTACGIPASRLLGLKRRLLNEIKVSACSRERHRYSIAKDQTKKHCLHCKPERLFIDRIGFDVFKFLPKNFQPNDSIINLLLPCKNSVKTIRKSIKYLMHEVRTAKCISFNICIVESNSQDSTLDMILSLISHINIPRNCNFYVISTPGARQVNKSEAISAGIVFLNGIVANGTTSKKYYFSSWDDEISSRIKLDHNIFESNLRLLESSDTNKAVSGYMIDNRKRTSAFLSIHNNSFITVDELPNRSMVHNGGAIVVRWSDMLKARINKNLVPGIAFSGHLLLLVPYKTLKGLSNGRWPLLINAKSPIFHPAERDILQWTIKYLDYFISWEKSIAYIKSVDSRVAKLWIEMLNTDRAEKDAIVMRRIVQLNAVSSAALVGREFMHSYYSVISGAEDKERIYSVLKKFKRE